MTDLGIVPARYTDPDTSRAGARGADRSKLREAVAGALSRAPITSSGVTSFAIDTQQQGDALALLRSLPDEAGAAAFFDPQHRSTLERLQYGNEGARQKQRHALPAMSDSYIEECCREIARVLRPSGYLFLWADAFRVCRGDHRQLADVLPTVDLIAWDNGRFGMGYRSRRCGDYVLGLQKPPLRAKATWHDHKVRDRWVEKVDARVHPHIKPIGLIRRLITAVTAPGDLIIDPAAGSFLVMHIAHDLSRRFIGCDLTWKQASSNVASISNGAVR